NSHANHGPRSLPCRSPIWHHTPSFAGLSLWNRSRRRPPSLPFLRILCSSPAPLRRLRSLPHNPCCIGSKIEAKSALLSFRLFSCRPTARCRPAWLETLLTKLQTKSSKQTELQEKSQMGIEAS